jgi:hypothetical protein
MLFHVEQNAVSRETTIARTDATVLNEEKLLIRPRKVLFHVKQNVVSRETDLIRTVCHSNGPPSWLVE